MKNLKTSILLLLSIMLFSTTLMAQIINKPNVYNFDNQEAFKKYQQLNLDATHNNLLDPATAKDEFKVVVESWTDLHQKLGSFLKQKKFDWGTEDTLINVVDRIYFDKAGCITHYFFNVLNESISKEKTDEFAKQLADFGQQYCLNIQRKEQFAQCGKIRYSTK